MSTANPLLMGARFRQVSFILSWIVKQRNRLLYFDCNSPRALTASLKSVSILQESCMFPLVLCSLISCLLKIPVLRSLMKRLQKSSFIFLLVTSCCVMQLLCEDQAQRFCLKSTSILSAWYRDQYFVSDLEINTFSFFIVFYPSLWSRWSLARIAFSWFCGRTCSIRQIISALMWALNIECEHRPWKLCMNTTLSYCTCRPPLNIVLEALLNIVFEDRALVLYFADHPRISYSNNTCEHCAWIFAFHILRECLCEHSGCRILLAFPTWLPHAISLLGHQMDESEWLWASVVLDDGQTASSAWKSQLCMCVSVSIEQSEWKM